MPIYLEPLNQVATHVVQSAGKLQAVSSMSAQTVYEMSQYLMVLLTAVPVSVAVFVGPTPQDHYTIAGAALAALIAGLIALSERRPILQVATILLSSAVVGTVGPGITLSFLSMFMPSVIAHIEANLNWKAYGGAGLFYGFGGWPIVMALISHWKRNAKTVTEKPFKYFEEASDKKKPHDS